ncbi:membrane protein [Pontibacillus halophilus JSM 076056 = DSM 19796]|uniref:Membrane protein n=1 Tax=Pontibacillus halophilus JSM 076056 = DSM 19796 TaxID=1385510 RepID=A0A0A5GGM3_9BACI|nr:hypothetical protein [Pontibacillus halophilus]KGX92391.1 membrane protein [Pontibacillus halophilus JSM 076056 = DSM 19796]
MINFQVYIIFMLLLLVVSSFILSKLFYKSIYHSERMVISMVTGTSNGLVIGGMLGSIFQGDLFISTTLGISIGVIISSVSNWNLGVIFCIEGGAGGLMGGMMGAMLGEMLPFSESIILIQLFMLLAIGSLILYPALAHTSIVEPTLLSTRWLLKPLLFTFLVVSILLGGNWISEKTVYEHQPPHHHSKKSRGQE